MQICKQPQIGAAVHVHDDNTYVLPMPLAISSQAPGSFLYTNPLSALGFWYALEPCTKSNGCLSFLPGSHKVNKVPNRFVRLPEGGTGFEATGKSMSPVNWADEPGWKVEECEVGTLVLIDGAVIHRVRFTLYLVRRLIASAEREEHLGSVEVHLHASLHRVPGARLRIRREELASDRPAVCSIAALICCAWAGGLLKSCVLKARDNSEVARLKVGSFKESAETFNEVRLARS
jgi:hypothetical protein